MTCPHCNKDDDRVIESRSNANGSAIRRRRECNSCGFRFTSYEKIEEKPLHIIKKDGSRELFSREKLQRGLSIALKKRPVSSATIEEILNQIESEAEVVSMTTHEIESTQLGEMVLKKLYEIDMVAYVRFASVYRSFKSVEEFKQEIDNLHL